MADSNNKRIAKNTLFLYIRMFLVMCVSIYTSRIVLEILGIDDYGIYNLVGGVVILFTFLSASMTTATQRHLCIALGQNNTENVQKLFSSSLVAHLYLILILIIIAETLGEWFIETQLVIPVERRNPALIVYQLSILSSVVNVYRIPFNAAILAHERMSFYAYSGIVEVILKLAILWPLTVCSADKLVLYGGLVLFINFFMMIWYILYSHYHIPYSRHTFKFYERNYLSAIFKFAGWSSFSAVANIGSRQGLNFLINIFYGVGLNATIGIMNQVSTSVYQFIINFQSAINPPLMKEYAANDYTNVRKLVTISSKFSFFLLFLLATPIIFNMDAILELWLEPVPPSAGIFCIFALISLLPNTIGAPIWTIMQAGGEIRKYQIIISLITILNIPVYYLILKTDILPEYTIAVQFISHLIIVIVGTQMGLTKIGITLGNLTASVLSPCFRTVIITWLALYALDVIKFLPTTPDFVSVMIRCCFDVFLSACVIWTLGLKKSERNVLLAYASSKISRKK